MNMLPELEKYLPLRVVVRQHINGTIEGLTEESFNMNWSNRYVRVFWSGTAYSMLGEHTINGIDDAVHNCKKTSTEDCLTIENVYDPLDPHCPIQVDWRAWLNAKDKYSKRNAPFKAGDVK